MTKRFVKLALVLAIAASVAFMGFRYYRTRTAALAQDANYYVTSVARKGDLLVAVEGQGSVAPAFQREVRASVGGTVEELLFSEGSVVKAGAVLARLSSTQLMKQIEEARESLQSEEDRLAEILNPSADSVLQARIKVRQAEMSLASKVAEAASLTTTSSIAGRVTSLNVAVGDEVQAGAVLATVRDADSFMLPVTVMQTKINQVTVGAAVSVYFDSLMQGENAIIIGEIVGIGQEASYSSNLKATVVDVTIQVPAEQGLLPGMTGVAIIPLTEGPEQSVSSAGTLAPSKVVDIKAKTAGTVREILVDQYDLVAASQAVVRLENESLGIQAQLAEMELRTANAALDALLDPDSTDAAKAQRVKIAQIESDLADRLSDVEALTVRAPIDGTALSLSIAVGDTVSNNGLLGILANTDSMTVNVTVDELDISQISIDREARITVEALQNKVFAGKVVGVSPRGTTNDGVATFSVTVQIDEPVGLLTGMTASVSLVIEEKQDVLLIPLEAVSTSNNRSTVLLANEGMPALTEITTGSRNQAYIEVARGLQEGDIVVVASNLNSSSGMLPMGGSVFQGTREFTTERRPGSGFEINPGQGGTNRPANPTR